MYEPEPVNAAVAEHHVEARLAHGGNIPEPVNAVAVEHHVEAEAAQAPGPALVPQVFHGCCNMFGSDSAGADLVLCRSQTRTKSLIAVMISQIA